MTNTNTNTYSIDDNRFRLTGMQYDPNGNIQALHRYNKDGFYKDKFSYHYAYDESQPTYNNQLKSVDGYVSGFHYNAIGQMTAQEKEDNNNQYVEYDVTGKVTRVYSEKNTDGTFDVEDLKVEYIYDDRGFRLAKVDNVIKRTTWYIRDASGNILSIYEQEGVASATNTHDAVQVEIPIYGSGKLGTHYPQQDGSTAYEITDHLGNVRAVLRDNINTYTATMEDNNQETLANPRVEEMAYFENLKRSTPMRS